MMPARAIIRVACWTVLGIVGVVVGLIVVGVGVVVVRVGEKGGAPRSSDLPRARTSVADPIPQLEDHTCGLLALSAAYTTFGLSPEAKNLRFRLGVDTPAHPIDRSSTGTLHPDLFRVLDQDGFRYSTPDPASADASGLVRAHVEAGGVVLTLIRRPESGGLHWVLIDDASDEGFRVVDSLKAEPTREPAGPMLGSRVVSLVAISAREGGAPASAADPHRDGADEMRRVRTRLAGLPEWRPPSQSDPLRAGSP